MTVPADALEVDVAAFRAARAGTPLRFRYERLMPEDRWERESMLADRIMKRGWKLGRHPAVHLQPPLRWDELCAADRSWHYHLHAWDGLGPILAVYDSTGEPRYFEFALALALDWARQHPELEGGAPFAWYDMAVGLRAYRLGYLLDVAARLPYVPDDAVTALMASALLHRDALLDEAGFASHSNHGFFQAAGQLALARRLREVAGMPRLEAQGIHRLRAVARTQFTNEGVHREHSPGYHRAVMGSLSRVLEAGLDGGDAQLRSLHRRTQEALAWFIMPNGRLPAMGDTSPRIVQRQELLGAEEDALRFAASGGQLGSPPTATIRGFPESGYVVVRSGWRGDTDAVADCSYLVQTCAFHSRTHKHADDLSFIWYDRGTELLTDPGRYGYSGRTEPGSDLWKRGFWYSDPNRIYVESTRAHNTVEIDGRSYDRARQRPYGSALQHWGQTSELAYTEASVNHADGVRHTRLLVLAAGRWLVVLDLLADSAGLAHRYVQRFHFGAELVRLSQTAAGVCVEHENAGISLHATALLPANLEPPARGQRDPLLGWTSRAANEMTPIWTIGYAAVGSAHVFATLLSLSGRPDVGAGSTAGLDGHAELVWRDQGGRHKLRLQRSIADGPTVAYANQPSGDTDGKTVAGL